MRILVFLIFFGLFTTKQVLGLKFINGLEDIPLYKEMEYVEDSLVLFDKIDGRYVSTEIIGSYIKKDVIDYYKRILPNLGWNETKSLTFQRADEILEIRSKKTNDQISIIFSIYPRK